MTAIRPIEFATVMRTQDISPVKQTEDAKAALQQQNIAYTSEKTADIRQEQVYQKQDGDMDKNYDASKDGKGPSYEQSKSKRRKKEKEEDEDGTVTVKNKPFFDVKI